MEKKEGDWEDVEKEDGGERQGRFSWALLAGRPDWRGRK